MPTYEVTHVIYGIPITVEILAASPEAAVGRATDGVNTGALDGAIVVAKTARRKAVQ